MEIYSVGGSVRDTILGLDPKDRDYVVVGASYNEMIRLRFKPVGADFPVFLHPETQEEYALARTERKVGPGYGGFATKIDDVTLEEDLGRRDLTVNAMALSSSGELFDPFNGVKDIERRMLRHVSTAFSEDPLRVLRVARFHARYGPTWTINSDTLALMKGMVKSGDLDHVAPERIWAELDKGLKEKHPVLMLDCLQGVGFFDRAVFCSYRSGRAPYLAPLNDAVARGMGIEVRAALAFPTLGIDAGQRDRTPAGIREASRSLITAIGTGFLDYSSLSAEERLHGILSFDGIRQGSRFEIVADALDCMNVGVREMMSSDMCAIRSINRTAVIGAEKNGLVIKEAIRTAQVEALSRRVQLSSKRRSRP